MTQSNAHLGNQKPPRGRKQETFTVAEAANFLNVNRATVQVERLDHRQRAVIAIAFRFPEFQPSATSKILRLGDIAVMSDYDGLLFGRLVLLQRNTKWRLDIDYRW